VVRLQAGDPGRQTIFAGDPVAMAERWAGMGARWLHVVNLDGAFAQGSSESPAFASLLRAICAVGPCVQYGGGLRSLAQIEAALMAGVSRVVLGTVAVEQPELVRAAVACFGPAAIAVGIDARGGRVRLRGWQTDGGLSALDLGRRVQQLGVQRVIHTDIGRDGLLGGVNAPASAELAQTCGLQVIASGGVAGLDDIRRVQAVAAQGVEGVIVGRALYQGILDLRQALALVDLQTSGEEKRC